MIVRMVRAGGRWVVTVVATVASMYALDAVATMAGLALVASGVLAGLPLPALAGFLLASYAFWAVGLRASVGANWALLQQTGASTNAVSKLAYDATGATSATARHPRLRRWATAAGYVGTELVKEIPYYAGAIGAVLINGDLTAADVILFLGGANLGAAAYEYGLARLTRLALRRRPATVVGRPMPVVVPAGSGLSPPR
jgi:hypothetical protein